MTPLAVCIQLIIKPLIIIALGALQYLGSKSFSASARHANLLIVMLLLPVAAAVGFIVEAPVTIALPSWGVTQQWLTTPSGLISAGGYMLGVFWGVFYLLLGILELHFKRVDKQLPSYSGLQLEIDRLTHLTGIKKPVKLILSEVDNTIASWGWLNAKIQLPVSAIEWDCAERQLILLHELGHVARRDWVLLIIGKLVSLLFWFLPPVWWLQKMLSEMSERASDDWVIQVSGRDGDYAKLLLSLEKQLSDLPVSHLWAHSNFSRIKALLERYADHEIRIAPSQWGLSSILALLVLLPLTAVGFRDEISEQNTVTSNYVISEFLSLLSQKDQSSAKDLSPPFQALAQSEQSIPKPVYIETLSVLDNPVMTSSPMEQLDLVVGSSSINTIARVEKFNREQVEPVQPNVQVKGFLPVRMMTPIYPRRAIARGIEGRVKVQFTIGVDGVPFEPSIVFSQPKGVFDKSVFKALKQSRFRPMTINGAATEVKGVSEEFVFKLGDADEVSPPSKRVPLAVTQIALTD